MNVAWSSSAFPSTHRSSSATLSMSSSPSVGREVVLEEEIVIIESVKATSEINAPVAGTVFEVNEALEDHPELINESSLDAGWLICIESNDTAIMDAMMDEDAYREFVDAEM